MSVEINDANVIKELLNFYKDDLEQGFYHPRTREIIYLDNNDQQQLVNYINISLYKPEVILIWGSDIAYSQLEIWSGVLRKSNIRHAIFCKSLKGKEQKHAKLDNVPIYGIKEGNDTKSIANFSKSVTTMLYMTDKNENFGYMRSYPNLIHVAAHHGDSDKHASYNRLLGAYDYLLVADKNSMNRYLSTNIQLTTDHFLTIGNSVIDSVKFEQRSVIKNILYAPTFEGHNENVNYSSLKRIFNEINNLNDYNLILRAHPGTGLRDKIYKDLVSEINLKVVDNFKKNKANQFNWSDVLICDISGILSEYIFTGKPIIIPVSNKDGWLYSYINNLPIKDYVYLWDFNKFSLIDFIDRINSDDFLYNARIRRRNELFCGVENINQSVELYDKALKFLASVKYWRDLKSLPIQQPDDFLLNPSDPKLAEIVNGIRAGKMFLKFDLS